MTPRSGRADGLCGQSAAPGSPATLTIDACTDTGTPGSCASSPKDLQARRLGRLDAAERKAVVIAELIDRFGPKARITCQLSRTELDGRAVFGWRDDQSRPARCAD